MKNMRKENLEVEKTMQEIKRMARLAYITNFIDRYFEFMAQGHRSFEAWELTEAEHREIFGHGKYNSYESFVSAKNRYLRNKF